MLTYASRPSSDRIRIRPQVQHRAHLRLDSIRARSGLQANWKGSKVLAPRFGQGACDQAAEHVASSDFSQPPPSGPYASDDTSGTFALASCADACASSSCSPRHHGVKLVICPHTCRKGLPLPRVAVRNAESTDVGPKVDRHLGSVLPKVRRGELAVGT